MSDIAVGGDINDGGVDDCTVALLMDRKCTLAIGLFYAENENWNRRRRR